LGAGSTTATTAPRTGPRNGSITVPVTVNDVGGGVEVVGDVSFGVGATVFSFPQHANTQTNVTRMQRRILNDFRQYIDRGESIDRLIAMRF
jgi:hypothetical protein